MEKKLRWEWNNYTACCFKQILDIARYKAAALRPHTSHLTNHLTRGTTHAENCCWSKDELVRDVLKWINTHGHTSVGRLVKILIQQLCANTGCHLEDLPWARSPIYIYVYWEKERGREGESEGVRERCWGFSNSEYPFIVIASRSTQRDSTWKGPNHGSHRTKLSTYTKLNRLK